MEVMNRILEHTQRIQRESVRPGMPASFTAACQDGDAIRQGDLYLVIVDEVPTDYIRIEKPTTQLVPGNTEGAKHCLDSLDGVELLYPANWNEDSLEGPCFALTETRKVLHPVHGHVVCLAGTKVLCLYQREWDKEQAKERRTQD